MLLQCYSQSHHPAFCWWLERLQRLFQPLTPLIASVTEWWNDGLVLVKSWNSWEPQGWWLCEWCCNSTMHKAAGLSAAIQNGLWRLFLSVAPIHTQWDTFQWNGGIVPRCKQCYSQSRWPHGFPALRGTIPLFH